MNGDFISLANILQKSEKNIELSRLDFVQPIFLVGLLCLKDSGKIENITIQEREIDKEVFTYLNRSGFLKHVSSVLPKIQKNQTDTLVEITVVDVSIAENSQILTDLISKILKNIGFQITKDNEPIYYSALWFIQELIANITIHSGLETGKGAYFMMQAYKKNGSLSLSIVDSGIGIKNSFRASPYWNQFESDKYFIQLAFQRGKTSDRQKGAGNGLYFTKELIKHTGGSLKFLSGNCLYTQVGKEERYLEDSEKTLWDGVLIDLSINLNTIKSVDILKLFEMDIYPGYLSEFDDNSSIDNIFI